jgi:2-epi-valiolone-7-phosphate 1-reductase
MQAPPTHTAVVVSAPGQMRIESVPTRYPQAGEILVVPKLVGICGSDLDLLRGNRPLGTRILGHEGIAEVAAVGPGVSMFAVGQYVTFLPNNPRDPADTLGVNTEGLNQRSLLISQPALERGMVVRSIPGLSLVCAPLSEPFATVIYGQHLVEQVCSPESIVIVGAGPIGLLNALYARRQGLTQIFLVDTSQTRLDWAVERGIVQSSHAFLNSPQLADTLLERTAGRGVDAAYLCTPRAATRSVLTQTLLFVRAEGCIDLTAGTNSQEMLPELPGIDVNTIRQANFCGLGHEVKRTLTRDGKPLWITGQSGASEEYLQEAMQSLIAEPAWYARVISHIAAYSAAPRIFERLLGLAPKDIQGVLCGKVILDFTREGEEIEVFDPHSLSNQ